jgi:hypothetical protein
MIFHKAAAPQDDSVAKVTYFAAQLFLAQLKAQMVTVLTSQIRALNPFVTLDLNVENEVNGPNLVFSGVNLILRTVLTAPDWVI